MKGECAWRVRSTGGCDFTIRKEWIMFLFQRPCYHSLNRPIQLTHPLNTAHTTPQPRIPTTHHLSLSLSFSPSPTPPLPRSKPPPPSQSAFFAIGGYITPSFSTPGSHVHHASFGTLSMTIGTCKPQPHQEDFSKKKKRQVRVSGMELVLSRRVGGEVFGGVGVWICACMRRKEGKGKGARVRHVSHVPALHMVLIAGWEGGGGMDGWG